MDNAAGTELRGALFRVNPTTGARTLVTDFGDAAQGPQATVQGTYFVAVVGESCSVERLADIVASLETVTPPQKQRLIAVLQAALVKADQQDNEGALGHLEAFIRVANNLVRRLSPEHTAPLVEAAHCARTLQMR